eukprot:gene22444-26921_t
MLAPSSSDSVAVGVNGVGSKLPLIIGMPAPATTGYLLMINSSISGSSSPARRSDYPKRIGANDGDGGILGVRDGCGDDELTQVREGAFHSGGQPGLVGAAAHDDRVEGPVGRVLDSESGPHMRWHGFRISIAYPGRDLFGDREEIEFATRPRDVSVEGSSHVVHKLSHITLLRKNPERRLALIDAAIEVLAREGARGLTFRAVDAQAAVPNGTASNYFSNRDDLLTQAGGRIYERLIPEDLEGMIDPVNGTDRERLVTLMLDVVERVTSFGTGFLALMELRLEATRRPDLRAVLTVRIREDFDLNVANHLARRWIERYPANRRRSVSFGRFAAEREVSMTEEAHTGDD